MKKIILFAFALFFGKLFAQNPGLVISEVLANPAGTDSCKEYVELLATQNITFSNTPYTIIVSNNGAATANGWINGGAITYAFAVTTGSVAAGDVVYVGGSCMAPTGTQIRVINVKTTAGDGGIGTANAAGVFGNGGGNADGVAVFNLPIGSITAASVPVDAVFFGTGVGTASVTGGTQGYELPVNDLYGGGKFISTSYFAPDPASDVIITATGIYNTALNTWSMPRTISVGTTSSNAVSGVSLTTLTNTIAGISFLSNDTTVLESASSATVYAKITTQSTYSCAVTVSASALSNASGSDYTLAATTVTFAANAPVGTSVPVVITLNNDAVAESAEYAVLRLVNPVNATVGGTTQCNFYIKDDDKVIPSPSNALTLNLLSSFSNSITGSNSAEIVVHDPTTQRLYIANSIGAKLDIVDFVNPSSPTLLYSIPISTYGNINSVAVKNGTVAAAIENSTNPQDSGKVVFFDKNGTFLKQVTVGMMPDMVTFNHAGTRVITANEGEPNQAYTNDPDGSVSIINISGGIPALTNANVAHVTFTVYNGQEATLKSQGIRIYGLSASASKDFEPEYVTVAKDDSKCWVTLQENNAIVEINLATNAIINLRALGSKDHSLLNNGIDASNMTKGVNIANFPIKGLYLPDAVASYTVGGIHYLITANEGDSRAYTGFTEERRIAASQVTLDPVKYPNASEIKNNWFLGRLNITDKWGDTDGDGDIDTIFCYGSRSFSIWNATTGNLVYDSKDDLEQITSTNSFSLAFNASNSGAVVKKDRSDDKGPEPEGVAIGTIGANTYAFIALERIGGVIVYDVTTPSAPTYVTYVNNLNIASGGPDRGAEGIVFIPQSESPNGQHLVIAANEISSTLSIWGIAGCTTPIASSLTVANGTVGCSGVPVLSVASSTNTYQWTLNGSNISGATSNTYAPATSGNYGVNISGGANCSTSSLSQSITINPTPTVSISNGTVVCAGFSITQTAFGANTYTWSTGATGSVVVLSPSVNTTYTVTGTGAGSCTNSAVKTISVAATPTLNITSTSSVICVGQTVTINVTGASGYLWNTGASSSSISAAPSSNTTYSVTGYNAGICSSTAAFTQSVSACTGIESSVADNSSFSIYPNPANTEIILLTYGNEQSQLNIYNSLGQLVKTQSNYVSGSPFDISGLPKGIYTINLTIGNYAVSKKLIVN